MGIIKRRYQPKKQQKPVIFYRAEVYVKGVRVSAKLFLQKEMLYYGTKKKNINSYLAQVVLMTECYLKDCLDRFWKDAESRMMKSTIQSYETRLMYFYNSPLEKVKMSEFKGIHAVEWIDWLKKTSNKT